MRSWHVCLCAAGLFVGAVVLAAVLWWGGVLQPEAGPEPSPPRKVYVVQEIAWRFTARGDPYVLDDGRPGRPVKAFLDRDRADAHCRELTRQRQRKENPFCYQPEETSGSYLDQYASRGEAAFLALLRSEGRTPAVRAPDPSQRLFPEPWVTWWAEARGPDRDGRLTQRLWDALDRVRFYEVIELDVE
jgi:hypothetical protein